jgi:hypothetical protein
MPDPLHQLQTSRPLAASQNPRPSQRLQRIVVFGWANHQIKNKMIATIKMKARKNIKRSMSEGV